MKSLVIDIWIQIKVDNIKRPLKSTLLEFGENHQGGRTQSNCRTTKYRFKLRDIFIALIE